MLVFGCGGGEQGRAGLRVVSLVPSATEVVYALGAESLLVGSCNQCDYPEAALHRYRVGDFVQPDMERVVALKPSLVLVTLPIHQSVLERLRELGIRAYVSQPHDIASVFWEIESLGTLLGRRAVAESLVLSMRARLDSVPGFGDTPSVYVEISGSPLMTAGRASFINELVSRAGGRNCFGDAVQEYPVIDPAAVVQRNPDVILILHPDERRADVERRVGWQGVAAVRSGRVYEGLDEDLLFRPGPRIVEGVALLARLFHPSE